ncbi:MAG TPA: aminotransferase class IV [Herpetosiphonaceae bacterium]|nr:aminotransferase class IV [Herpetosiphonaceae bacterium]
MMFCLLNGRLLPLAEARIDPAERGWTLADGCFETLRVVDGAAIRLEAHLGRLGRGLALLGIPAPDRADAAPALARLLGANGRRDGVARLQVTRGVAARRGLLPDDAGPPTVLLTLAPPAERPDAPAPIEAIIAGVTRRNEWSPLSQVKALANYPDALLALGEARRRGADDALLLNTRGELCCSSVANLWLASGDTLRTPPLGSGATAGVVRAALLEAAPRLGLRVAETPLDPADLWAADEALLTNSVRGVQSVVAVDGRPIGAGAPGPLSRRLLEWFLKEERA